MIKRNPKYLNNVSLPGPHTWARAGSNPNFTVLISLLVPFPVAFGALFTVEALYWGPNKFVMFESKI